MSTFRQQACAAQSQSGEVRLWILVCILLEAILVGTRQEKHQLILGPPILTGLDIPQTSATGLRCGGASFGHACERGEAAESEGGSFLRLERYLNKIRPMNYQTFTGRGVPCMSLPIYFQDQTQEETLSDSFSKRPRRGAKQTCHGGPNCGILPKRTKKAPALIRSY